MERQKKFPTEFDLAEIASGACELVEKRLSQNRNFRWILVGTCIATFGNQFTALALPWLVLKLTGDSLALASVMAVQGLPQAALLLLGGTLADRYSPRRMLLLESLVYALLLFILAGLILFGVLHF